MPGTGPYRFKLIIFNLVKDHNIGTLIRAAYAFGCHEVLLVGRKKFKITGTGGTYRAQSLRHFFSMEEAAAYCSREGFAVYGVEIGGIDLGEAAFDEDIAFVLGNEGRGISDAAPYCKKLITIPQWGGVPSLNVAVAGGIVMHAFQSSQNLPRARVVGQRYVDDFFRDPEAH